MNLVRNQFSNDTIHGLVKYFLFSCHHDHLNLLGNLHILLHSSPLEVMASVLPPLPH